MLVAQNDIPTIQHLQLSEIPKGTIQKYWLEMVSDGFGQPISVPILIAKGVEDGPVLGITAGIHGNELNGIPVIQRVFGQLDPKQMRGIVIAIPGLNVPAIERDSRTFLDETDLNRIFPGKKTGNRSQQYVYQISQKILKHFDYLLDLHTASFGRVNSLYVRADMENDTLRQMAELQHADILLHSQKPSFGAVSSTTRTLRQEATRKGIAAITVELGNPQVYQSDMILKGAIGVQNTMSWLGMISQPIMKVKTAPVRCQKSYWIYTDAGGLLTVPVRLAQKVEKGDLIGILKNPFGDVIKEYRAPEDGVIIGKSSNPVNMSGGRIIHLGILEK